MKAIDRMALLYDFYGPLLTPRQQELIRDYYLDDLSLGEIAGAEQVSRQAIHDQIKRAEASLAEFEVRLGLVAAFTRQQAGVERLQAALEAALALLPPDSPARAPLAAARREARALLDTDSSPEEAG